MKDATPNSSVMSRWISGAALLAILVSGCLSASTDEVPAPQEPVDGPMSIWEERMDPDYFEYEQIDSFRMEYDVPREVVLPAGLEYVSVWVAFYAPDPASPPTSGFPEASGRWSDGSSAFEIVPERCCGGAIPPSSSGTQLDGEYQALTDVPGPNLTLTILGRNGGEGFYLEITIEKATPVPLVGEPPYIERLDIDYFERVRIEDFRVDYPAGPLLPPTEVSRKLPPDYEFLIFSVRFVSETPASSAWVLGQPGFWPTLYIDFDAGSGITAKPYTIGGIPSPSEDTVEVIVRRAPDATTLTARTEGWGVGHFADVTVFGAVPVDPGVEPEGEPEDGRTSRG